MTVADRPLFDLDAWFARDLDDLALPWRAAPAPDPRLVVLNEALAAELGVPADALRAPEAAAVLVGTDVPEGAVPVAQAYSGHQFGNYSPRLGDGRALLLGEVTDTHGTVRDLHLKGSGRTPFARGGDGKAPLAPMLREYLISEAMAALSVPTTRSLAVLTTGEPVTRESVQPGAVLVRVATSHLRVGTFQFAAALDARAGGGPDVVRRVAEHAITRHHPQAREAANPYLALLDAVVGAQARLVAQWMLVGFVHGVMNTDNMTISGETIDYGPCAFLDVFDPTTVYSSIDHGGRYAYGNQPAVAAWNLARLAEALVPLLDEDTTTAVDLATETVRSFIPRYGQEWNTGMRAKLGLADQSADPDGHTDTDTLIEDLVALLRDQGVDYSAFLRALSDAARGDTEPARSLVTDLAAADAWIARWRTALASRASSAAVVADAMDRVNPRYIPRNHLVQQALDAAVAGDLGPFERLREVLTRPFEDRPGLEAYAAPGPRGDAYVTYCGT